MPSFPEPDPLDILTPVPKDQAMPKPLKTDALDPTESAAAPVITGKPADSWKTAPVSTPKKFKPRYVRVENKLRQVLSLSVINDDGRAEELKLAPLATSEPLREDRLTDQVRRLSDSGRVRIR